MSFGSLEFSFFFVLVYAVYWRLDGHQRKSFLLLANCLFYAAWDWRFVGLLLLLTVVGFLLGARIGGASSENRKSGLLALSLAVNLGVLGVFKYFDFFAVNFAVVATWMGWHVSPVTLRIMLPIGISFYTFRSLSYTIDIRRGQLEPTSSLLDYAVYMTFFPLMGAGPITRARQFLPQLSRRREFNLADLEAGLSRFLLGLCKKMFIADTLGLYLVDPVFAHPAAFGSGALWLALFGYSVQIYADFSGYSSMAIGISRTLGFKISENFAFPYLAGSVSDFWRRWHISMTSWFRDYLWWSVARGIPFSAKLRSAAALIFVFLVSGLWHGASWTFVAWGGLHGLYLVLDQQWRRFRESRQRPESTRNWAPGVAGILVTNALVALAWLLFRSPDFGSAFAFLLAMFREGGGSGADVSPVVVLAFAGFLIDHIGGYLLEHKPEIVSGVSAPVRGLVYASLIALLWNGTPDHANQFIYFQF